MRNMSYKLFEDGDNRVVLVMEGTGINLESVTPVLNGLLSGVFNGLMEGTIAAPSKALPIETEEPVTPDIPQTVDNTSTVTENTAKTEPSKNIPAEDTTEKETVNSEFTFADGPYAGTPLVDIVSTPDEKQNFEAFKYLVSTLGILKSDEKKAVNKAIVHYIKRRFPKGFDAEGYTKSLTEKQAKLFLEVFGNCVSSKKRESLATEAGFDNWDAVMTFKGNDVAVLQIISKMITIFSA